MIFLSQKRQEIGTEKVISEHSTIGIVITSDGSFTDLDVEEYNKALDKTVNELKNINKPFIILVNSIILIQWNAKCFVTK